MRVVDVSVVIALLVTLCTNAKPSHAQEISGFSTISVGRYSTGGSQTAPPSTEKEFGTPAVITNSKLEVAAYIDTQEDYTAQMYYDVQSASSVFQGGSQTALSNFQTAVGAPTAAATYLTLWSGNALYTEATAHIVYFFYVASSGAYADPYGFSTTSNDGDYNSGYWFSVYSNLYVEIASIILGESFDSMNSRSAYSPDRKW